MNATSKTTMTTRSLSTVALAAFWLAGTAGGWAADAAAPAGSTGKEEAAMKHDWVREHVLEVELKAPSPKPGETKVAKPGLTVLANNDPVQLNAKSGKPMKIGTKEH